MITGLNTTPFGGLTVGSRTREVNTAAQANAAKAAYEASRTATLQIEGDQKQVSQEAQLQNLQFAAKSQQMQTALPTANAALTDKLAQFANKDKALAPSGPSLRAKGTASAREGLALIMGDKTEETSSFKKGGEVDQAA